MNLIKIMIVGIFALPLNAPAHLDVCKGRRKIGLTVMKLRYRIKHDVSETLMELFRCQTRNPCSASAVTEWSIHK